MKINTNCIICGRLLLDDRIFESPYVTEVCKFCGKYLISDVDKERLQFKQRKDDDNNDN